MMIDSIEERLQDLEQLVLKQAERIDALEGQLQLSIQVAATRSVRAMGLAAKDAA